MVRAAATQAPEETYIFLTKPLLESLAAEVQDVASLAAERARARRATPPSDTTPSSRPPRRRSCGGKPACLARRCTTADRRRSRWRPRSAPCCARFALCDEAKSLRLGEMAAHVSSLLCGALTGTCVVDLFAARAPRRADSRRAVPVPGEVVRVQGGTRARRARARGGRDARAAAVRGARPRLKAWRWRARWRRSSCTRRATRCWGASARAATRRRCRRNARAHSWHPSAAPRAGSACAWRTSSPKESRAKKKATPVQTAPAWWASETSHRPIALETRARGARAGGDAGRRSGGRHRDARSGALRGGGHPAQQPRLPAGATALRTWRADASALTKPLFGDDPPGLKTRRCGCWASTRSCGSCGARRRRTTAAGRDRGPPRTRRTRGCWRRCAV